MFPQDSQHKQYYDIYLAYIQFDIIITIKNKVLFGVCKVHSLPVKLKNSC